MIVGSAGLSTWTPVLILATICKAVATGWHRRREGRLQDYWVMVTEV